MSETAVQKARREAEEARKRQDQGGEAARKEEASGAANQVGATGAQAKEPKETQAAKDGQAPPLDPAGLDGAALMARLDAQDRLIKTLTAQTAGNTGPALDEAKDAIVQSPGAQFDPRMGRVLGSGVQSGPANQPHPTSGVEIARVTAPDAYDWEDGEVTVWGRDAQGRVIRPRTYPQVTEQDVLVTATGYHEDTVRNAGDVIRGYTGPLASWMAPVDDSGRQIPRGRFLKDLADAS